MSSNYQGKRVARTRRTMTLLFAVVVAGLILAAAVLAYQKFWKREPQTPGLPLGNTTSQSGAGSASSAPDTSLDPQQMAATPNKPVPPPYDFSQPAPEGEAVDNSYFDDAAFVGDSRTDGFMLYSGLGTGKNLTSNGLSIFKLEDKKALTIGGNDYTLLEALALEEYGKVYLCLGVNELGVYRDNAFYESYCSAIDQIRQVQPNAVIYIQGLIPVNIGEVENYNGNKYGMSNDHLRVYNDLMRQAAAEKQVVYLDLYSAFVDETGELPEGASRDGVHLGKDSCIRWLDYLKTHTVDFDTLYPDGPPAAETADTNTTTADGSVQG